MKNNPLLIYKNLVIVFLIMGLSLPALAKKAKHKKIVSISLQPETKRKNITVKKDKKIVNKIFSPDVNESDIEPLTADQQSKLNQIKLTKVVRSMPEKIHNPLDDQKSFEPKKIKAPPSLNRLVNEYAKDFESEAEANWDEEEISSQIISRDLATSQ